MLLLIEDRVDDFQSGIVDLDEPNEVLSNQRYFFLNHLFMDLLFLFSHYFYLPF